MLDGLRLALIRRLEKLTGQDGPTLTPEPDPTQCEALRKQGNQLIAQGHYPEAESCFREALALQPDSTPLLICLGYVLKEQARFAEARVMLRRVANRGKVDPEAYEALYLLAEISELEQDTEDARRHLTQVLELQPDFTRACADLIRLLRQDGQEDAVRDLLVRSVEACPQCMDYRLWLAEVSADSLDLQTTVDQLTAVVDGGGGNVRVLITLGAALCRVDRYDDAVAYFDQAQAQDPSVAYEVCYHRAYFQSRIGNTEAAIALYEQCIEQRPDYLAAHQMLLYTLCLTQPQVPGRYRQAAERFNRAVRPPEQPTGTRETARPPSTQRALRIGFTAGEFKHHPLYYFLIGILAHIDRTRFQLIAYSYNRGDDKKTLAFKEKMDAWNDIQGMSDDATAALIRSQQIDILIDLSGHTGDGLLPVFARRPATVQATWLGYFASTGLEEMDFILADPVSVPDHSKEWFSETVIRLPSTRLCMATPHPARPIPVRPPPCAGSGYVTFGSFAQATKINPQVLRAWSRILERVPRSRLRMQSHSLDSAAIRQLMADNMQAAGLDMERVDLVGASDWEDYMEAHHAVDMLLDTFPYTGGTTTASALWMGVPTLTIQGDTMLALQGACMMRCVDLPEWIAMDETDFVEKAVALSGDVDYLARLRAELRHRAERSPLFDTETFTRHFEAALTEMFAKKMSVIQPPAQDAQLPPHGVTP